MNVHATLSSLYAQKKKLEDVIAVLEQLAGSEIRARPGRRGRKSMGEAERRQVSARIKKYWDDWRSKRAKIDKSA
jgi:hypothetical protein